MLDFKFINSFKIVVLAIFLLKSNISDARFNDVMVRMQSGKDIPLLDLPWFRFQFHIAESQWKNQGSTADWVIFSTPKHCIMSAHFRLNWSLGLDSNDISSLQTSCNNAQRAKYKERNLSSDELGCNCDVVLRTASRKSLFGGKSVWISHNDDILLSDEIKLFATIKYINKTTPIILSFGSSTSGIYALDGTRLCQYSNYFPVDGAYATIRRMLSDIEKPIPITCIGGNSGMLDISKISYSILRSKMTGDVSMKLNSGEVYEIKFD